MGNPFAPTAAQIPAQRRSEAPENIRRNENTMRRPPYANATPDESAALFTSAMVLALFGVLAVIEAPGWVMTSTLFITAAVACVGGLVLRHSQEGLTIANPGAVKPATHRAPD